MVKLLEVVGRRADFTHEAFIRHQITAHVEVVASVPEFVRPVRRYIQNHLFIGSNLRDQGSTHSDSVVEVWYDNLETIKQAFTLPGSGLPVHPARPLGAVAPHVHDGTAPNASFKVGHRRRDFPPSCTLLTLTLLEEKATVRTASGTSRNA